MKKKQKLLFLITELEKMRLKTNGDIRIIKNKIDSLELFNRPNIRIEVYRYYMKKLLDRKARIDSIIYDINQQI